MAKISDQTKLGGIAVISDYQDTRKEAVAKISDPAILLAVIRSGDDLSEAKKDAISRISDTATLLELFEEFRDRPGIVPIHFLLDQIREQEALEQIRPCGRRPPASEQASLAG